MARMHHSEQKPAYPFVRWFAPIVASLVLMLSPIEAHSTTYYVDGAIQGDSGAGTQASPKKYIPSGIALLSASGGDTLIIKNGTYSGSANVIRTFGNGSPGAYNTIRAETDGSVVISSTILSKPDTGALGSYTNVIGLKFTAPETKGCDGTYMKFFRCAVENGQVCSSGCDGAFVWMSGSHQLYEDCWFYGWGGRYTVANYENSYTVYRRCVIRREGGYTYDEEGQNPEAAIVNYAANHMSYQNVLVIDNTNAYSTGYTASFYVTGHEYQAPANAVEFIGCMDINGQETSFYSDTDDGSTGMTLTDCVFYNNETGIAVGNTGIALAANRVTIGRMWHDAMSRWSGSIALTNGVVFDHASDGSGTKTVTYTNTFDPSSYSGTGVTHVDPLTNGLLYLPRIEAGSVLKTSGNAGGQMGAQIMNRIGTSGTLYGEPGYNTVTGDALWPWPNEDRIKTDFASVSAHNGARGFATGTSLDGSPQTLTKYIWEQLGHQIPADIYASPPTGYAAWRTANFSGTDLTNDTVSGPLADPDRCGLSNLARYAFGLTARGSIANPITVGTATVGTATFLTLTFPRRATAEGLTYTLESSTDLVTWRPVPNRTFGPGSSPFTVEDVVPIADELRRFLRLRVTGSP
jgi:hypothetical protein